jgi:hypothetical protein
LRRRWPILLLGAAVAVSTLLLLHLGRGQTLVVDQWGYLSAYRSWAPGSLLAPHNGHLIVLPLLVYKAMFEAFGIGSQLPYQLVTLGLSATVAVLLFLLIRDGIGEVLALAAATLILFYGAGADVILPTFQFPNQIGLASGLAMLLLLRRGDIWGDAAACLFLAMSLASFSIGLAFAAGAAVMLVFRPGGRLLSGAWVWVVPGAAYAAWVLWARKYNQDTIYVHNLKIVGSAFVDQLGAVLAGLTGLFTTPNGPPPNVGVPMIRTDWAPALVVGLAAILAVRLRRPPRVSTTALAAVAVLTTYFLLVAIALNVFRNTSDTRLVYLGSVLVLLAVAELYAPYRPSQKVLAAVGVVFVVSMCANIAELGDSAKLLREQSAVNRAKLAAVGIAGEAVSPELPVEEPPASMSFDVETLHELEAEFGSPAFSETELLAASPGARKAADEELVRALAIEPRLDRSVKSSAAADGIELRSALKGATKRRGACLELLPVPGTEMEALVRLPVGGMAYATRDGVAEVSLGRFADAPTVVLPQRRGSTTVRIPPDASRRPWVAAVRASGPALVCPAAGLA